MSMTITLPDGAAAGAILTVASAVVWAIRVIAKAHIETLQNTAAWQKEALPMLQRMDVSCGEITDALMHQYAQLVRVRRAIKKVSIEALTCDECHGWFGENNDRPQGMEMCRCSDPTPTTAESSNTGQWAATNVDLPPQVAAGLALRPRPPASSPGTTPPQGMPRPRSRLGSTPGRER